MTSFWNIFILRRPRVVNFADIIKIVIIKGSKKLKARKIMYKMQLVSVFFDIAKFSDFHIAKCWCQQNCWRVSRDSYFSRSLDKVICAKVHHCMICVTDFIEGLGLFNPLHPWAAPKRSIINRIKIYCIIHNHNEEN